MLASHFYFKTLLLVCILCSGCSLGYILEQSQGQYELLFKAEPLEKALTREHLPTSTKNKIKLVQDVKNFSVNVLKLKTSKNFSSFVQLNERYVTYVVTASAKNKIQAYTWNFPIVGKVPYKGFFKKQKAETEFKKLQEENYDVLLRGVSAYSTLGWFSDPLLSSMTDMSDEDLVETIIHELTHQTYFKKNDLDFNERLATFVGEKGAILFYQTIQKDQDKLKNILNQKEDSILFHQFMKEKIIKLEEFYALNQSTNQFEEKRQIEFEKIKSEFKSKLLPKLKTDAYKNFQNTKLNNAVLLNYKLYYGDLDFFEKIFSQSHSNWELFFQNIKSLPDS